MISINVIIYCACKFIEFLFLLIPADPLLNPAVPNPLALTTLHALPKLHPPFSKSSPQKTCFPLRNVVPLYHKT